MCSTRLSGCRESGGVTIRCGGNEAQTGVGLARAGADGPLQLVAADGSREDFVYEVRDQNQCAGCHASNNTTREILPVGRKARHLNKYYVYSDARENPLAQDRKRLV